MTFTEVEEDGALYFHTETDATVLCGCRCRIGVRFKARDGATLATLTPERRAFYVRAAEFEFRMLSEKRRCPACDPTFAEVPSLTP